MISPHHFHSTKGVPRILICETMVLSLVADGITVYVVELEDGFYIQ